MKVAITAKRAVILFMTMALAVAMVACQGAVGQTGETGKPGPAGPPGEPSEPKNLAPIARIPVYDAVTLREGGENRTFPVAANFVDPDGNDSDLALTLSVSATPEDAVETDLTAGVLTVIPMEAGEATIIVTATDPKGAAVSATLSVTVVDAGVPMYIDDSLTSGFALTPGDSRVISGADIASAFNGESLTYSFTVEGSSIHAFSSGDNNEDITIAASDDEGVSTVTIIATDEDGEMAKHEIKVTVVASLAPQVGDSIPDQTLVAGGDSVDVDASMHFSDPAGDDLTYGATSSDESIATAVAVGSIVTITPGAAGDATVTVTATNSSDLLVSQTISVTVDPAPVVVPAVTWKKEIPDVTFEHDGAPETFTLAEYFNDATMYVAMSDDRTVVTAAVNDAQTMLTLTREGPGTATVEVTPSNSVGKGVVQSINVTVKLSAATPKQPTLKPGKTIPTAVKVVAVTAETANAYSDFTETSTEMRALNAAEKLYMLSDLIKDPERADADLEFSTETSDPTIVGIYADPADDDTSTGNRDERAAITKATLDKTTPLTDSNIRLRGRKAGTATVTITASSDSGESESWPILVTVAAASNTIPSAVATPLFPGDGTADPDPYAKFGELHRGRIKSTDTTSRTLPIDLGALFDDADVEDNSRTTGDSWKFKAMSTNTEAVTVTLDRIPTRAEPDKHNVVISPVGSGSATIYFTVEDSFGEMAGGEVTPATDPVTYVTNTFFNVQVNHAPVAMGGQKDDPKTLGAEMAYRNLTVGEPTGGAATLWIVDDDSTTGADEIEGYFSDEDGDELECKFVIGGDRIFDTVAAGVTTAVNPSWTSGEDGKQLTIPATTKRGTATLDITCWDQVGPSGSEEDFEHSSSARLTIHVGFDGSIR